MQSKPDQLESQSAKVEPRYEIEDIPISEKLMAMHHAHLERRAEMTDDSTVIQEPKTESDYKVERDTEPGWNIISVASQDSGINAQTDSTSSMEVDKEKSVREVNKPEVRREVEADVKPEVASERKPEVKQSLAQKFMNMMGLNDRDADSNATMETELQSEDQIESSVDPVAVDIEPTIQANIISVSDEIKYQEVTDIESNRLQAILEGKLVRSAQII